MSRTLSSYGTYSYKVLFPILWILVLGPVTIAAWLGALHDRDGPAPEFVKWLLLAFFIIGTPIIVWLGSKLKFVRIDETSLYISTYLTETAVPLNMISEVSGGNQLVTLHFRSATKFGQKIVFIPAQQFLGFGGTEPVAAEIKRAAGLSE